MSFASRVSYFVPLTPSRPFFYLVIKVAFHFERGLLVSV